MATIACHLQDITTDPSVSDLLVDFNFLQEDSTVLELDGLEYALGLTRGDVKHGCFQPLMRTKLRRDMAELFEDQSWALLPHEDVLEVLLSLVEENCLDSTLPESRTLFTDRLPAVEYTYSIMPLVTEDRRPLYIGDRRYDYPYINLPLIKSLIHPAFVLPSLDDYRLTSASDISPNILIDDENIESLISRITNQIDRPLPITWLHGAWSGFPERGLIVVREFPKSLSREMYDDDGYETPEERDFSPDDPRVVAREKKLLEYMAEHNERPAPVPVAGYAVKETREKSPSEAKQCSKGGKAKTGGNAEGKKRSKSRSTGPLSVPTPSLRRSSRPKLKNPPKYK